MMKNDRFPLVMAFLWLIVTLGWWALAFAPVPEVPPEWLVAAKNACFGTLPNGLPDTFGWVTLIFGPLALILALYVVWPQELKVGLIRTGRSWSGRILLMALALLTTVETVYVGLKIEQGLAMESVDYSSGRSGPLPEGYLRTHKKAQDFALINQLGEEVTLQSMKGKTVFLTFAYAHCATVCPVLVKQTLTAMESLDPERTQALIITLDPWRDTPSSLPHLADKWKLPDNAFVLSGPVEEVKEVIAAYGVPAQRNEKTGEVTHPAISFVLDTQGQVAFTFNNASPQWMIDAAERLSREYVGQKTQ